MKKFKSFIFVALAAFMTAISFTACSDDDSDSVAQAVAAGNEIKFNTSIAGTKGTRAIPTTLKNLRNFGLFAQFASDSSYYIGSDGTSELFSYNNGVFSPSSPYYWPATGTDSVLNFYAYAPRIDAVKTSFGYYTTYKITGGGPFPTYTTTTHRALNLTYTVPQNIKDQKDLILATALNQSRNSNNGIVNLTFQHLLSQLKFAASKPADNLEVTISKVHVINVSNEFDYLEYLKKKNQDPSFGMLPGLSELTNVDFVVAPSTPVTVNSKTSGNVAIQQGENVLMLPPQYLYQSARTKDEIGNFNTIKIECKVKDTRSGRWIIGSDSKYESIEISPKGLELQPGKSYTIVFDFTGERFGTIASAIRTNVTVNDWQETGSTTSTL